MATQAVCRPTPQETDEEETTGESRKVVLSYPAVLFIAVGDVVGPTTRRLLNTFPLALARNVAVAMTADLGDKLLRVFGPRPEYEAVIRHQASPEPDVRCVAVPEHVWRTAQRVDRPGRHTPPRQRRIVPRVGRREPRRSARDGTTSPRATR